MRSRSGSAIAGILSLLLLTGMPVHAGPVVFSEVVQLVDGYQNPSSLMLRGVSQNLSISSGVNGSAGLGGTRQGAAGEVAAEFPFGIPGTGLDTSLSGVAILDQDPVSVQVIDQGDVEGTICDCGEILVAGAFPKWPLLFLAAIPFFFIETCNDCDTPVCVVCSTPTPTPPSTPPPGVPEPATLFLFGTGLAAIGATLRRRYIKSRLGEGEAEEKG